VIGILAPANRDRGNREGTFPLIFPFFPLVFPHFFVINQGLRSKKGDRGKTLEGARVGARAAPLYTRIIL